MILLKDLDIGYHLPLIHIDQLELTKGQLYILMGKNGSGKSTFLKTLSGLIPPLCGECKVNGKEIVDYHISEIPRTVSYVATRQEAVDFMSVFDFVALGRSPYTGLLGKLQKEDEVKVLESIDQVGISHLRNRYLEQLSDGERQMAAIAKALCQRTELIILDEPTAFLDYTNKIKILTLLEHLSEVRNLCILISSHDVDISLKSSAKILVIDQHTHQLELADTLTNKENFIFKTY